MKTAFIVTLVVSFATPAFSDGPRCTPTWPFGFDVKVFKVFKTSKKSKRKPVVFCTGGELQSAWDGCVERRSV